MPRPELPRLAEGEIGFFVDRSLGSGVVPARIEAMGHRVARLDDFFAQDCKDREWIVAAAARGWLILTKDGRFRSRASEWEAVVRSRAAVFALKKAGSTGEENAQAFARALPKMIQAATKRTRPLVAIVTARGDLEIQIGERRGGVKKE